MLCVEFHIILWRKFHHQGEITLAKVKCYWLNGRRKQQNKHGRWQALLLKRNLYYQHRCLFTLATFVLSVVEMDIKIDSRLNKLKENRASSLE